MNKLIDRSEFRRALAGRQPGLAIRGLLSRAHETMQAAFETGTDSSEIVYSRARLIDLLLAEHWAVQIGDLDHPEQIALVATGGYGRAELHPCSDIDLLILLNNRCRVEKYRSFVSKFVTLLWDAGLNVGHSVRTIAQCDREARNDITIATNLLESRLIAGPEPLFSEMQRRVGPNKAWSTERFFRAKLAEQQDRHRKYGETGYRLEPNLKESPGGLRDAQMIGWVAKSHFGVADPAKLLNRGFLNRQEYDELINARAFLWRIRVALHFLAGRSEDQLLFDHQRQLAPMLGFGNRKGRRGVEGFMRQYYRSVTTLRRLNEMLLQYFQEAILGRSGKIQPINERFQSRGGYLEARDSRLFEQQPSAMLELFLIMEQQRPKLEGVRAGTIRQLRNSLSLINAEFRADPVTSELFMAIFHQPKGVSHELQRMNRYGVMAAYIPEFDRVTGLMQHDLFHIYTVDEHTLILIRNLRRFAVPEWQHDLPMASGIFANLPKPQLLYLAGLFHDIGKGRGGDHSAIGARIATRFCRRHGLSFADAHLVSWLVGNHLKMSMVSQRQDISDPDVLAAFADLVGDSTRLDYLLLLTIADMRATNPNVWNDWKASLLFKLYDGTRRVLARGIGSAPDRQQRIRDLKAQALELIDSADNERARTQAFWRHLEDSYWLRHSPREMAWHGRVLAKRWGRTTLASSNKEGAGSTALLVYAPDRAHLFATVTAIIEQQGCTIVDARINTTRDGFVLDTFQLLGGDGDTPLGRELQSELRKKIEAALDREKLSPVKSKMRVTRRQKLFTSVPEVNFYNTPGVNRTVMELRMTDRPGLLSRVASILRQQDVRLHDARINTYGERVEDTFFISTPDGQAIDQGPALDALGAAIADGLQETV